MPCIPRNPVSSGGSRCTIRFIGLRRSDIVQIEAPGERLPRGRCR
jgi:hypothetical protein